MQATIAKQLSEKVNNFNSNDKIFFPHLFEYFGWINFLFFGWINFLFFGSINYLFLVQLIFYFSKIQKNNSTVGKLRDVFDSSSSSEEDEDKQKTKGKHTKNFSSKTISIMIN